MVDRKLASAKIRQPFVGLNAIARRGPSSLLDQVPDYRVTVVTGPAGFGKTWLVSDWLYCHSDWHQSWVTIDAYDRDPMRLWRYIVESVQQSADPDTGEEAGHVLASGRSGIPLIVDTLTADLARRTDRTVIVFDDVHHLDGDESVASMGQFLSKLPDNASVILVGRHDAPVPLSRMRLSDDLLEIRTTDLRCTLAETQTLVTESLGLALLPETVAMLHTKTMGWLAGVRLASESISRSRDMSRSASELPDVATLEGAYDALGDYLLEEVLVELDEEDRQFLLDTSILHDLSGPLCDAVSERSDSAEMLERLARSAMFTSRIGEADGWYRYHDLFRDAMTGILRRTAPDRHVELHHRAAMWFREHGDTVESVDQVLRAGEPDLASQWLVESCQEMLLGQQYETMRTLFARVDEASDSLSPITLLAWCYPVVYDDARGFFIDELIERTHDSIQAMIKSNNAEQLDEWNRIPELVRGSPSEFIVRSETFLARRHGDVDKAIQLLEAITEPSDGGRVEGTAGEMLIYLGRVQEGSELLRGWNEFVFSPRNSMTAWQALALTLQAWAALGEGKLGHAEALAARGVQIMESQGLGDRPYAAVAKVPLAWAAFERGRLDIAADLITPSVDLIGRFGEVPAYVFAHILLARINYARGRHGAALASFEEARILPSGRVVTGYFADRIALERARLSLLTGDVVGAEVALPNWRERMEEGATTMTEHLILARMAIAAGEEAEAMLVAPDERFEITTAHRIEIHKLQAHLAVREGADAVALDELTAAMRIAAYTGHTQTFLDDTPVFGALLDNAAAMSGHRLRTESSATVTTPVTASTVAFAEPLTERELEVLRLLPSHLTYKGMADALFVSPNTIKAYLKAIYRKLDADRRSKAVENARALGLID